MLKFKEHALKNVIEAVGVTGVKLVTSPKVTQAVLNTVQLAKKFPNDIKVYSSEDGIIIAKSKDLNVKNAVLFTDDTLVEFSDTITPDLYHKSNDTRAEFRYYPAMRQMMRVRSRNDGEVILMDDDHNTFRVPSDIKYISAKQSIIPIFFPKLIKDRSEATTTILKSNEARGMDNIKVGDTVVLREYSDMVAEFGDEEISFGYGEETMRVTAAVRGADTIVLTDHVTHLCGQKFKVASIVEERQEITLTNPQTKLVNPKTGEELPNSDAVRFGRLHFLKV